MLGATALFGQGLPYAHVSNKEKACSWNQKPKLLGPYCHKELQNKRAEPRPTRCEKLWLRFNCPKDIHPVPSCECGSSSRIRMTSLPVYRSQNPKSRRSPREHRVVVRPPVLHNRCHKGATLINIFHFVWAKLHFPPRWTRQRLFLFYLLRFCVRRFVIIVWIQERRTTQLLPHHLQKEEIIFRRNTKPLRSVPSI